MTTDEAIKQIDKLMSARGKLADKIVAASRAVVPVLLDAGRSNSAKELQELFFQYDALEQELAQFIGENPDASLAALVHTIRRKP